MTQSEQLNKLNEILTLPGETELVEFKEARNDYSFEKLGKYFSALSNEANLKNKNCSWLIFGVNKNHQVIGTIAQRILWCFSEFCLLILLSTYFEQCQKRRDYYSLFRTGFRLIFFPK
ncbi:MAG: ATP-binding protein [Bacteroidota bacterium]